MEHIDTVMSLRDFHMPHKAFIKILKTREIFNRNENYLREKGWKIDAVGNCLLNEILFLCSTCCDVKLGGIHFVEPPTNLNISLS